MSKIRKKKYITGAELSGLQLQKKKKKDVVHEKL